MPNLLVVSGYADQHFEIADYVFVHHQVLALQEYFDRITVVAPTPWAPRWLGASNRLRRRLRLTKRDYRFDNVEVRFARFPPWTGHLPGTDRVAGRLPSLVRAAERSGIVFDAVHAHMSLQHGWHGLELSRRYGVPCALTVHDSHDGLMRALRGQRRDLVEALRETDALIRVSPNDIDEIRLLSGTHRPIHYIPNGFDANRVPEVGRAESRRRLGLPLDRPIFVAVARWLDRKDPLILLDALHRVKSEPGPLLCLLGEDLMDGRIQRRAAELGLEDDLLLLGPRDPSDVLLAMRATVDTGGDSFAVFVMKHPERFFSLSRWLLAVLKIW